MSPQAAGICLAAGASSRMGAPKALLRFGEETALLRATSTLMLGGCSHVVAVLGAGADDILRTIPEGSTIRVVVNDAWEQGRSGSVRSGVEAAPDVEAWVILPVDHPLATPEDVAALLGAFEENRAPVVRPVHEGRGGHPILLNAALKAEIEALGDDEPLRNLVRTHRENEVTVLGSAGTTFDMNTPEDYRRALERMNA